MESMKKDNNRDLILVLIASIETILIAALGTSIIAAIGQVSLIFVTFCVLTLKKKTNNHSLKKRELAVSQVQPSGRSTPMLVYWALQLWPSACSSQQVVAMSRK